MTLKELKERVSLLLEITKCPVCLESFRQEKVECLNGHLICSACKGNMEICPTCRGQFSRSKPSRFVSQIVEILPSRCKYRNCPTILTAGDDHEKYCGLKLTKCNQCPWEGLRKETIDHWKNDHLYHYLGEHRELPAFDIDKNFKQFTPIITLENDLFWEKTLNELDKKLFTTSWQLVPTGKPTSDRFVTLSMSSDLVGFHTTTKIKLDLDPDVPIEENSISVPHKLLPYFINELGTLSFSVTFQ